jgi:hypothetical protein
MPDLSFSHHRSLLISGIIMAVMGWLGLYLLLSFTLPTLGPRWLFIFLLTLAATGTALPIVYLLHRRFDRADPPPTRVLLRQGLWIGFLVVLCMWLQMNRTLSLQLALLLTGGIVLIEASLRFLERSAWRPRR